MHLIDGSMTMIVSNQKYCTLAGESSLLIVMNIWESEPPLIMNSHCTLHTAEHNLNYYPFIFYGQCQWIRKTEYIYICRYIPMFSVVYFAVYQFI